MGIILLTSFLSLGLVLCVSVWYKQRTERAKFIEEVKQQARLMGEHCRPILSSKDLKDLEQCLSRWEFIPYISECVVMSPDGKALASYNRSGEKIFPSAPESVEFQDSFEFKDEYLLVVHTISENNRIQGELIVRASAFEIERELGRFKAAALILFVLMLAVVYFLAKNLQRVVTKPLSNLLTATKNISGQGEAGARIKKQKKNEFSILRDRLKYLLEIENMRDTKLEQVEKARKKALELEKMGKEYRERFENNSYGIFVFEAVDNGEDFVVKDLNNTGEVLERIHRADLIGKRVNRVFPEVRDSDLMEALKKVWQKDTKEFIPFSRIRKDEKGWREFYISKLSSNKVLAAFRDVTEKKAEEDSKQKEKEEEKKRFEKKLTEGEEQKFIEIEKSAQKKSLNKELEGLYSAVESVLGEPLEKINDFSKYLLQNYAEKVDDKGKDQLIQIRAASHRLMQMTKEFSDLVEMSFDRLKLEQVDLSDMVRKRAVKLKEGNPERKAEFIIQKDVKVKADARLLSKVVDCLLSNAWIYSSKKANIKIEFGVKENKEADEYFIKDNGIGFEMKDVEEMFHPFKKLNQDEVFPGSGMGLAVVRRIIHKHGGTIRAKGKPGKGAVFYFTLGT